MQDFPWVAFTHRGKEMCPAPSLTLHEGTSGDFSEIWVTCTCTARQFLSAANAPNFPLECGGHRPWLGTEGREACEEMLEGRVYMTPTYGNTLMGLACSKPVGPHDGYKISYYAPQPRAAIQVVDMDDKSYTKVVGYGKTGS